MHKAPLLAMALMAALPLAAKEMTLDDLTVGQTVLGPKISAAELKGKVVYVEYWGTR